MRRNEINALLRRYAEERLTPSEAERHFVSRVYGSVCDVLGAPNCLQIGSYPRFTAITPLHDLDVLYVLGDWNPATHDPSAALAELEGRLRANYVNPTEYTLRIARQTHSITLRFLQGDREIFGVDIVPAYISGINDFADDMYVVPEIAAKSHRERATIIDEVARGVREMNWISSDPRGYIAAASGLNRVNEDFRKAVKIAKGWRSACKRADNGFALKSFHLEQAITRSFHAKVGLDIFGAVFRFFVELPDLVRFPQIPDRADRSRFIDQYVEGLNHADRQKIIRARDAFLIKLEELQNTQAAVADLLAGGERKRASQVEAYLFDSGIPMLTEVEFGITATALERDGGFRRMILDRLGFIGTDRQIEFRLGADAPHADLFKWKVKNDDASDQPRGEINDHRTFNDPENTKYKGNHFVECFAIRDGVCIGRSRQNVVLQWGGQRAA